MLRYAALDVEVLTDLRKVRPTMPVIILTARGSEDDRVRGLKMGADDYVVKPFSARELLARVEAVLRRSPGRPAEAPGARLGRAVIDLGRLIAGFEAARMRGGLRRHAGYGSPGLNGGSRPGGTLSSAMARIMATVT